MGLSDAAWQVIWEQLWEKKLQLEAAARALRPFAEMQRLQKENAVLRTELAALKQRER